ncbi:MAG TPA: diguanylate cyclase [Noviherbaspirillum sp.]|nr:diguanylate cyclase [Noviherbaspirillum sp.]
MELANTALCMVRGLRAKQARCRALVSLLSPLFLPLFLPRLLPRLLPFLLTALLFLGLPGTAAAEALTLRHDTDKYPLGRHLSYLEDRTGHLRLTDVMDEKMQSAFVRAKDERPSFGFTESTYWFRLHLQNEDGVASDWMLEAQYPLLDEIDVYLVYPDNRVAVYNGGDTVPFRLREVKHHNFTFGVPLPRGEEVFVYLRVKTQSAMQIPLVLWSEKAFFAQDREEQLWLGAYYGLLAAMFFYNLMIFLSIRDVSYLYYLQYIGGWILFQMSLNGLAFEYLWPDNPWWGNRATPFFITFVSLGVIQFTRAFLQLKIYLPRLDFVFRIFLLLTIAMMAATFILSYGVVIRTANVLALIGLGAIFTTGIVSLRIGQVQARYFMLAWAVLLAGSMAFILKLVGILPSNFLTDYGMQMGSALEVTLLSFALAHRMRILKEENVRIQKEATEMLEARVQQRTQELDTALRDLSVASEKLKDLSRTDGLTGCKNRTSFSDMLETEWQRSVHSRNSIGLLMLDIDHFKRINDTYGHLAGDACLKQVAQELRSLIRRPADEAFRYGGEEFAILLPNTDLAGAVHIAETILSRIESLAIVYEGKPIPVTVSIGVACTVAEPGFSNEVLISGADKALYEAKRLGRNQVRFHAPEATQECA